MTFEGVMAPILTPFRADKLYEEGLSNIIDFLREKRIHGLFVCGTYGLGPLLSVEEKKKVAQATVDKAGNDFFVMFHVGSSRPQDAFELEKFAEDIGADAISSIPPFYYAYDDQSIALYYTELVSRANIPVYIYNNPARSGNPVEGGLLNDLAEKGVSGIVDSSFSIVKFWEDMTSVKKEHFEFIMGTESLVLPAMMSGAKGFVSGAANIVPEINIELYNSIRQKKYEEATENQLKVIQARRAIHAGGSSLSMCYEILRLRGVDVGEPRHPFTRPPSDQVKKVKGELERLGLL